VTDALSAMQRTARMDVGKISETIYSAGGSAYNGTDLEPDDFDLGDSASDMIASLISLERDFRNTVRTERDEIEHQIRTRAILELLESNSHDRLKALEKMKTRLARG